MPGPWTALTLLRAAEEHLAARGIESPRLDAELLLARVLRCDRLKLYVDFERPAADHERAAYRELIRRRASGEPVAYILGEREFHGLMFAVDGRCLVPRPETEHLVDEVLSLIRDVENPRVADIGTGSGCIAISLARERADLTVDAVDASSDALAVARANAERLAPGRVTFFEGDLCSPLRDRAPYDVIASNPPYITTAEMAALPRDVGEFEPHGALHCGDDPVAFHRRLVREGAALLKPRGSLVMELGDTGARPLTAWVEGAGEARIRTVADLSGVARVAVVTLREKATLQEG